MPNSCHNNLSHYFWFGAFYPIRILGSGWLVPIAHGFRKFFSSQLVEVDLKTELRWLLEGHNLKGNDPAYVRTSEKNLQEEYKKSIDNLTIDPANRLRRTVETLKIEKSKIDMLEAKIQKLERKYRK